MLTRYWLDVVVCHVMFLVNDLVSEFHSSAHYAAPNEALNMMDDMQELTPS